MSLADSLARSVSLTPDVRRLRFRRASELRAARVDIAAREGIRLDSTVLMLPTSVLMLPTSERQILRQGEIEVTQGWDDLILRLITLDARYAATDTDPRETANTESILAATKIVQAFPASQSMPRAEPDGEGGVIFIWDQRSSLSLMTVDRWTLHLTIDAGTENERLIFGQHFDGERLPETIETELMQL